MIEFGHAKHAMSPTRRSSHAFPTFPAMIREQVVRYRAEPDPRIPNKPEELCGRQRLESYRIVGNSRDASFGE